MTMLDPVDDGPRPSFTERLVERTSALLAGSRGGGDTRRRFLAKTAVVGSAIVANPLTYLLRPGTAYGALCGTCSDGWTAFCCTINGGRNTCPSGSFVAGWWKADNADYCCGAARYIIDCNATCPRRCSCRCSGASCDGRRVCCNQFRYGQCHQEITCYGPVVCRVATCTPPWQYDRSCTTRSATDNRTVTHGAPCLSRQCGTPISRKYAAMGGAGSVLGRPTHAERPTPEGRGRYALYERGGIWWTPALGAHEVHGAIEDTYRIYGGSAGQLGFPKADTATAADGVGRFSSFEKGVVIYRPNHGAFEVHGALFNRWKLLSKENGPMGYPVTNTLSIGRRSRFNRFQNGSIYWHPAIGAYEVRSYVYEAYRRAGGPTGPLGLPITGTRVTAGKGGRYNHFERGSIYWKSSTGAHIVQGAIDRKWASLGREQGVLGYPVTDELAVGDDAGRFNRFDKGAIYANLEVGVFEVHGAIFDAYADLDGPTGDLGYPVTDTYSSGSLRRQDFQEGRLTYDPSSGEVSRG